jgi:hypothetical protein
MKAIFFSLLFSLPVYAQTLRELDVRQSEIADSYLTLVKSLPNNSALNDSARMGEREVVNKSITDIRKFFRAYDEFNLVKIDYFFTEALKRAREEALIHIKVTGKLPKEAAKQLQSLEQNYTRYMELKIHFGTEQDMERLDIGQNVLPAYALFAKAIRKDRGEKPWRNFGSAKIVPFVDSAKDFLKVSGQFARLLWNSYFRTTTKLPDRAPITEALTGAQRKLVKMRNIKTSWEGLENIKSVEHDGKTLHMFLINHANSFYDTSAQQAFPIKGMSSMGNVDIFFPPFLARRMVKSDHIVAVGHGDTTQKSIDLVRNKKLNRFFLAVEGITGVGLYEMRPVMPLFNFAIYDSIARGLELKLYPVAFPDNFRLMNDWRSPIEGPKVARGVVHEPFDNKICLNLKEITQTDDAVSQLLRWNWFSSLPNSDEEVLGMPYPSEIMQRLDRMIWGND